jgi:hypothetical protein
MNSLRSFSRNLRARSLSFAAAGWIIASMTAVPANAQARLAVKSSETIELGVVYHVLNCKSVMVGAPQIEVLEAPDEIKLSYKEEMVLPRRQGCSNRVPGGKLLLNAAEIKESGQAKLSYRLKYDTKDGPRQLSGTYLVTLFP